MKTQVLGRRDDEMQEIRILNKVVRVEEDGIELEADPRHAELVVRELGLEGAKASPVPGSKESTAGNGGTRTSTTGDDSTVDDS